MPKDDDDSGLFPVVGLGALLLALSGRDDDDDTQPPDDGNGDDGGNGGTTNQDPSAEFTTDPQIGYVDLDAGAASDPDGSIVEYAWTVEANGQTVETGTGEITGFSLSPGSYVITLTTTDNEGGVGTLSKNVTIPANQGPTASISTSVSQGTITVDGSGSTDPDGSITSYNWTLKRSGAVVSTATGTATTFTVDGGDYTVELVVGDDRGATDATQTSVTVPSVDASPCAGFSYTTSGNVVSATSTASDPDGDIDTIEWYAQTVGGSVSGTGTGQTFSHEFSIYGSWDVRQVVTDSAGNTDEITGRIDIPSSGASTSGQYGCDSGNDDGGSGGNGGDNGGNGDDDNGGVDTNEPPNVAFDISTDGTTVTAVSQSSDPDGQIVSYFWLWTDSNGNVVGSDTGQTVTRDLFVPGTYTVEHQVDDDDNYVSSSQLTFSVTDDDGGNGGSEPTDWDHTLTIQGMGEPGEDTTLIAQVTGELAVSGFEGVDAFTDTANGSIGSNERGEIHYTGELEELVWADAPILTWLDGESVNPYLLAGNDTRTGSNGNPQYVWLNGNARNDVLEVALYQTRDLYDRNGWTPSLVVSDWLHESLVNVDLSHRIWTLNPILDPPTNRVSGCNPLESGTDCCDPGQTDLSGCSEEGRLPGALSWFNAVTNAGDVLNLWRDLEDDPDRNISGQSFNLDDGLRRSAVRAKDSNVLLTDAAGGGLGYVGGNLCVVGARDASTRQSYQEISAPDTVGNVVHNVQHEMGHNMDFIHQGNPPGDRGHGGFGFNDYNDSTWHRSATIGCNDCTNECGEYIPNREFREPRLHAVFTDCDVSEFLFAATDNRGVAIEGIRSDGVCSYCCDSC
jgi:hypothetical protein